MLKLARSSSTDEGTPGDLYVDGRWFCHTLELPWRDNAPRVSCIPPGSYRIAVKNSPRFGRVYRLNCVPGRSEILIHSGNWAGDTALGKHSHVQGCILLGKRRGRLDGQTAVLVSRPAVSALMAALGGQEETLEITARDNPGDYTSKPA